MVLPLILISMGLFRVGARKASGWGQKGPPTINLSHICRNNQTWHSYTLPKEDPKNV